MECTLSSYSKKNTWQTGKFCVCVFEDNYISLKCIRENFGVMRCSINSSLNHASIVHIAILEVYSPFKL